MISEESLISIMKLSKLWFIEDGVKFVLYFLQHCPTFRPALQLYFAFHHGQPHWIEPAFRALVKIPLQKLTERDAELLGTTVMWVLSKTISELQEHRQMLAYTWPRLEVSRFYCSEESHVFCSQRWQIYWLTEVAAFLLHPGNSEKTYEDLKEKLKSHDYETLEDGTTEYCIRETLDGNTITDPPRIGLLNKRNGILFYESECVNKAIALLKEKAVI